MNAPSNQEIERQYRVLKQTLEMHAILRDEYAVPSVKKICSKSITSIMDLEMNP